METTKKIEVTAVFYPNGEIHPLQFTWQGRVFRVQATGRHWHEEDRQHFLVMAEGEHMFELVFSAPDSCWYMGRQPPDQWAA